jgi:predicted DNA-binding transcriptional regulator YafY
MENGRFSNESGLSPERLSRLHRLAYRLANGPVDKSTLETIMRVDARTLYRDLDSLRRFGMTAVRTRDPAAHRIVEQFARIVPDFEASSR